MSIKNQRRVSSPAANALMSIDDNSWSSPARFPLTGAVEWALADGNLGYGLLKNYTVVDTSVSPYSIKTTDNTLDFDSDSGSLVANLPSASSGSAIYWLYVSEFTSSIQINPESGDTIEGISSLSLYEQGEFVAIQSDRISNWIILFSLSPLLLSGGQKYVEKAFADSPYSLPLTSGTTNVDATSGETVIQFPASATAFANGIGIVYTIRKDDVSVNRLHLLPDGVELINGEVEEFIELHKDSVRVQSTGIGWIFV